MINTYNESELHETLKEIYALEYNGTTEQKIVGTNWIADILLKNNDVIEIQTGNISALKSKIEYLIQHNQKIKVVKPIIIEKTIETFDENENLISKKKSPKRETVYSMLRGLTGIYNLLLNDNFEIELVFIKATEKRQKTSEKVQLKNKSRRHLKNWIPLGKKLNSIEGKKRFSKPNDYKSLLHSLTPQRFTLKELQSAILNFDYPYDLTLSNRKEAAKWSKLLIWLLIKLNSIEEIGKRGRAKEYQKK